MKIAIDFDGTIVENSYPGIGKEKLFAFEAMKGLEQKGHQLILWTYRDGNELEEAVNFCRKKGIIFYAVNKNYPEEKLEDMGSRKILADVYIDDRNLGGFPGWSEVWQMLNPDDPNADQELFNRLEGNNSGFFSRLKRIFS